jgi:hypothetical protein
MNRAPLPASALHLRIGRVVLDPGVLDAHTRPGALEAYLQVSLAARFGMEAPVAKPAGWMESVAGAVAARVRESLPGTES